MDRQTYRWYKMAEFEWDNMNEFEREEWADFDEFAEYYIEKKAIEDTERSIDRAMLRGKW